MTTNYYGRRILKTRNTETGKIEYRLSGQWVGHKYYGDEWGTEKQRKNAACGNKILGISNKIFWNITGFAGEKVDDKKILKSLTFRKLK